MITRNCQTLERVDKVKTSNTRLHDDYDDDGDNDGHIQT